MCIALIHLAYDLISYAVLGENSGNVPNNKKDYLWRDFLPMQYGLSMSTHTFLKFCG